MEIFVNIWKIDIYSNNNDQDAMCCTVVACGNTEKEAELLAEKDHAKHYPLLSKRSCAKSCGPASDIVLKMLTDDEIKRLKEDEEVRVIKYYLNHA